MPQPHLSILRAFGKRIACLGIFLTLFQCLEPLICLRLSSNLEKFQRLNGILLWSVENSFCLKMLVSNWK